MKRKLEISGAVVAHAAVLGLSVWTGHALPLSAPFPPSSSTSSSKMQPHSSHIGIFFIHLLRLNTQQVLYHPLGMYSTFLQNLVLSSLIKLPGLEHEWIVMRTKLRVSGS